MKNLLLNFHNLYNSLNQIKSSLTKGKDITRKYITSNKDNNSKEKLYLIIKKKKSINKQLNKTSKIIIEENFIKKDKKVKNINSYKYNK